MFGIVVLLIGMAVAVKGGVLPFGSGSTASNSPMQHQIDRATFTGAVAAMDAYHAGTATYVGAPVIPGVTVVRAGTATYCLQAAAQAGTVVEHEVGPGGLVTVGAC